MPTTKKNNLLEYKGHPLMRKENIIYYGSMSDSHIIMMQILESSDYTIPLCDFPAMLASPAICKPCA